MTKTRRRIDAAPKAEIALETTREQATLNEPARRRQVRPNQIRADAEAASSREIGKPHAKIGRRTMESDLEAMRRIDALFTARPLLGARGVRCG